MRILLISDTHGNQTAVLKTVEAASRIDAIIHLGDGEAEGSLLSAVVTCPVLQVAGNCDAGSKAPREMIGEWENIRLLLCHGDQYGVKAGFLRLIERGQETGVDAILYGHTHLARIEQHDGLWLINPGTMNQQAPFRSYILLELSGNAIQATIYPCPE
jgi:uncharacterized protein